MSSKHPKSTNFTKHGGSIRDFATMVMTRMREDESKLIQQMKKLIKERRGFAAQILSTEVDGWMAIHACALRGTKKLLKVLLTSGVDVNTQMGQPDGLPNKCTPLHMSCLRGDNDVIGLLLSKGADMEAVDSSNRTPVMYAVRRKHRRAVRFLEEKGANMSAVDFPVNWNDCVTPQPTSTKFCFF